MTKYKEPNFFALYYGLKYNKETIQSSYLNHFVYTWDDYLKLFNDVSDEIAIGESSPWYLYDEKAPELINHFLPETKIIIILRNPAYRAFSQFIRHLDNGLETTDNFKKALELEEKRIKNNWWWGFHYFQAGLYSEQIKRYFNIFNRNQIKILLYDDWKFKRYQTYKDILEFLGVNLNYVPDLQKKYKVSTLKRSNAFSVFVNNEFIGKSFFKSILSYNLRKYLKNKIIKFLSYKPQMDDETRKILLNKYEDDINKLSNLIDRDLSMWKVE